MNAENTSQRQAAVDSAVAAMKHLYQRNGKDAPDSVLINYPDSLNVVAALKLLIDTILPGRLTHTTVLDTGWDQLLTDRLNTAWALLHPEIGRALPFRWKGAAAVMEGASAEPSNDREADAVMTAFYQRLSGVRQLVIEDIKAAYEGDPAALTYAEVQLAYPGLLAVISHRLAHELYRLDVPIIPRIMSEWTHARTGVDINSGARIGHGFFIDHATGVVIGETCEIGNHVKIYQGVTLGARSFSLDDEGHPVKHIKRHPTVEDNVVIYANATILGGKTVIGRGSTIGGNVFLMESVPPNSFVASKHPELHIKTQSDEA
jgi:serine O-acetyltransferase